MPGLTDDLTQSHAPAARRHRTRLFMARQRHERSPAEKQALTAHSALAGPVFNSLRQDHPGPIARNDWRA